MDWENSIFFDKKEIDDEPKPDIAICGKCNWKGLVSGCDIDQDGTWEEGYYDIHLCPKCEDGGCIDNYDMSEKRAKEWQEWKNKKQ